VTVDTLFSWLGGLIPAMEGSGILLVISILVPCLALFLVVAVNAIVMVYAERKVAAFMQDRVGPMGQGVGLHAGKWGVLQTVADALKLLTKEDIIPEKADRFLFIFIYSGTICDFYWCFRDNHCCAFWRNNYRGGFQYRNFLHSRYGLLWCDWNNFSWVVIKQ